MRPTGASSRERKRLIALVVAGLCLDAGSSKTANSPIGCAIHGGPRTTRVKRKERSMDVQRPAFCSPVLCIDDFLLEHEAQQVLQECIDLKKIYLPARVFDGPNATKIDKSYRANEVVYLGDVFRGAPERSDILSIIKKKIWTEECRTLWHEGYYIFDIINYSTRQEAVISRYGDGNFYGRHQDTRNDHITRRLVTLVY
jgi:hypothetical protein